MAGKTGHDMMPCASLVVSRATCPCRRRAINSPPPYPSPARGEGRRNHGFTLIELAIVLVIIGLIVGGVLVGRDLIGAAAVRAQISQLEQFNTAANTFRDKYGGLPGDLQYNLALQFGFNTTNCNGSLALRDGNGLIDGYPGAVFAQTMNETGLFWSDLSKSHLIGDTISAASTIACNSPVATTFATVDNYYPAGKIGNGNYIYIFETGGSNWFGLAAILSSDIYGQISTAPNITPNQAYAIDSKLDDGIPTTGKVQAIVVVNSGQYQNVNPGTYGSAGSCQYYYFGSTYNPGYSVTVNGGNSVTCALSFKMQAGD